MTLDQADELAGAWVRELAAVCPAGSWSGSLAEAARLLPAAVGDQRPAWARVLLRLAVERWERRG